jgi:2-phospho-L-lactate/phosphoenolpyruvate guanylyltransferase
MRASSPHGDTAAGVTALVPLKALAEAKGRLASQLTPEARAELAAWMLARVVEACAAAPSVTGLLVIAGDAAAARLATSLGVEVAVVGPPGLDHAVAAGHELLGPRPATLVLAADLPLATGPDVEAVCTTDADVVIVPTPDRGTAALLRRPPSVIPTGFGPGSADRHAALAAAAGARTRIIERPALGLDVDTAEQLRVAGASEPRLRPWVRALGSGAAG